MAAQDPIVRTRIARLAADVRHGDAATAEQARRELAITRAETLIRRAVETAPPLDAETVDRLRAMITASGEAAPRLDIHDRARQRLAVERARLDRLAAELDDAMERSS